MPYYYYGFDPTYVLVLIGAVICLIASARERGLSINIPSTAV